ncbi:hypothetical protein QR680_011748 [Steinernema hermaphroditum]|uniref:Uncharacterized protein n=1 Tax=Steinernema hermaphroditum TaxID=289476 RepID=A0AA39LZG9_9BILA|nr:hypothetical protein QR680_011748 [Steinernema hermaphroditum]
MEEEDRRRMANDYHDYEVRKRSREQAEDRDGRTRAPFELPYSIEKAYGGRTQWEKVAKMKDQDLREALKENEQLNRNHSKMEEVFGLFEARTKFLNSLELENSWLEKNRKKLQEVYTPRRHTTISATRQGPDLEPKMDNLILGRGS